MKAEYLEQHFARLGARMKTRLINPAFGRRTNYAIDIQRDRHGEFFELRLPAEREPQIEVTVMQSEPAQRHLLLLVRQTGEPAQLDRFLCGHDERHWFVAAVPGGASSVVQAMEELKPLEVDQAQTRARLTRRQRNSRKNRAFRRQGEWFFLPEPNLRVDPKSVLRNEPIRRGAGKPHLVEEVYRTGGVRVYVCDRFPNGLREGEYRRRLQQQPKLARLNWRVMMANAGVYARGTVRHPDHAVITLPVWHRVAMNTETQTKAMANVAFLD